MTDEKEADNEWHLRDRLSKLTGGVATVHVGASTEVEMKEKMDRVDDAISATRAALKMGVVPGGGATLLHIARDMRLHLQDSKFEEKENSYLQGWEVLIKSLAAPLTTILYNAGITDKRFSEVTKAMMSENGNIGYNALTGELVDMHKEKILIQLL